MLRSRIPLGSHLSLVTKQSSLLNSAQDGHGYESSVVCEHPYGRDNLRSDAGLIGGDHQVLRMALPVPLHLSGRCRDRGCSREIGATARTVVMPALFFVTMMLTIMVARLLNLSRRMDTCSGPRPQAGRHPVRTTLYCRSNVDQPRWGIGEGGSWRLRCHYQG